MIVAYARGDGLGHLTRLRAVEHTLGLAGPIAVITDSRHATDRRVVGDWRVVRLPTDDKGEVLTGRLLNEWLAGTLRRLAPRRFFVDAFPAGLDGELDASALPPETSAEHLARLLRWDDYRAVLPSEPLRFHRTWLMEPVGLAHRRYLAEMSETVVSLALTDPPEPTGRSCLGSVDSPVVEPGSWLVVHAGPVAEQRELVAYASDAAGMEGVMAPVVLVCPTPAPGGLPPGVRQVDCYPALSLANSAGRIITAAGFNAVRQYCRWSDKHRVVPFLRRWDDQFTRAARLRVAAGRRAEFGS